MSRPQQKFVLFAHNATYDKLHQVATLGLTAAAMGKDVIVVLLFWTIKKLADGKIDDIDFPPEYAVSGKDVARLLKEKKVPKISEMFAEAKEVGRLRLIACSAGLEYMDVDGDVVSTRVDEVLGLPAILSLAADAETTLFI
jgi:peroxiredoxin family protein